MPNSEASFLNSKVSQQNEKCQTFQNQNQVVFKFDVVNNQITSFNPIVCKKIINKLLQQKLRQTIKKNINKTKIFNQAQTEIDNYQRQNYNHYKKNIQHSEVFKSKKKENPLIVIDIDQSQSEICQNHFNQDYNAKNIDYQANTNQVSNYKSEKDNQNNNKKNEEVQKLLEMINVIKSTAKRMKNKQQIQNLLIQAEKIGKMIKIIQQQQASQNQFSIKSKSDSNSNFESSNNNVENSNSYVESSNNNIQNSNSNVYKQNINVYKQKNNMYKQKLYWFSDNVGELERFKQNQYQFGYLKWSQEQDLLLQKINAHFQNQKIKKQLDCLLKYKTKELIMQRLNFLKIDIDYQLKKQLLK